MGRGRRRFAECDQRGQVIFLGAVTALLLSIVLFMVLNVAWSVHERIRIQNAADAQAYSQAVHVARAYNYIAYTNRAIAGAIVSMTMLHGFHSEVSAESDLFWAGAAAEGQMAGMEVGRTFCGEIPCCNETEHCVHAITDTATAVKLALAAREVSDDVKDMEDSFRTSLDGFKVMINLIYISQVGMLMDVSQKLSDGRAKLEDAGTNLNVPAGSDAAPAALTALNLLHFWDPVALTSSQDKARDMTDVVNAARPEWMTDRGNLGNPAAFGRAFLATQQILSLLRGPAPRVQDKADGQWSILPGLNMPGMGTIGAGIVEGTSKDVAKPAADISQDQSLGGRDWYVLSGICEHNHAMGSSALPMLGPLKPAKIYSNKDSGEHYTGLINDAHDGQHDLDPDDVFRYVGFKAVTDAPYGQPAIYSYAEQDLSLGEARNKMPWAITANGRLSMTALGSTSSLNLADHGSARAISKALVYYHRPGNWKEPPNFFNPYWRVKLHPFGKLEAIKVQVLAGDSNAAIVTAAATMGPGGTGFGTASDSQAMAPSSL